MSKKITIEALNKFEIGNTNASLSFAQRLARENHWTLDYAERVITEYKRFVFLVSLSDNEVTPSDEVDQAWHLHLTYTRSYWHELCHDLLGFELHHNPTQGGQTEQQKYKQQYAGTLAFYEQVFAETAPVDIWPTVEQRFTAADQFVRVNRHDNWILNKPTMLIEKILLFLLTPFFLVACTEEFTDKGLLFWLAILFGAYLVYKIIGWLIRNDSNNSGGGALAVVAAEVVAARPHPLHFGFPIKQSHHNDNPTHQ